MTDGLILSPHELMKQAEKCLRGIEDVTTQGEASALIQTSQAASLLAVSRLLDQMVYLMANPIPRA